MSVYSVTQGPDAFTCGFWSLFQGRDDVLGYGEGRVAWMPRNERVHAGIYTLHLHGWRNGIGVFPLRPDGTVRFCAIDLDEPDFDLARDFQLFLPGKTWIERSRSGNAHVWAFFTDDCPGWVARGILRHATESMGRKNVEVFPKQDMLLEGMAGNYINLPYHGFERPILAQKDDGSFIDIGVGSVIPAELSVWDFCAQALEQRNEPEAWLRRAQALGIEPPERRQHDGDFGTQPFLHDCAKHIYENRDTNPLRPGTRSAVLFHVAVQFLNYEGFDADEARHFVDEINAAAEEPLPKSEVDRVFRNAASGRYTFAGCDDPLMADYVHPNCPFVHG